MKMTEKEFRIQLTLLGFKETSVDMYRPQLKNPHSLDFPFRVLKKDNVKVLFPDHLGSRMLIIDNLGNGRGATRKSYICLASALKYVIKLLDRTTGV